MRARALALLLSTLALLPLFVARAANAQNADAGAPVPTNTTRPSLVPDATATTTTAPPPTTTAIPAATTPTPQVRPAVSASGDAKAQPTKGNEGEVAANPNEVFSEDWWGRTRPVFEIHGYFRTRAELLHNFTLGRHENPAGNGALFPQPIDNSYQSADGTVHNITLCGNAPLQPCKDQTQSGANMRFRMNPELHISDNLRIMAQVDAFDNMVLGSTPDSYATQPPICTPDATAPGGLKCSGTQTGYRSAGYSTFAPIGMFTTTQGPPTTGINSLSNSLAFKRAWAEYMTPLGQLRFGRMPSNWGLGILSNSGDRIDDDWATNVDRVMFVTGIKSLDLYFAGMWDFPSTGPTNASPYDVYGGQPVNTCNLCNVNQWGLVIAHRTNPELQKLKLARGDLVVNGGLFTLLRSQYLDVPNGETPMTINQDPSRTDLTNTSLIRRDAWAVIPDLWLQILYKKFRLEAEGVAILGEIGAIPGGAFASGRQTDVRMWGMAAQTEFRALEDKLHLQFDFGYASGDQWALNPIGTPGLNPEMNGKPISTFSFHPAYTVDLIFFRKILTRIEGAYYFRPEVDYDFIRNQNGQRFGGGAALIWSRASEFIQTPGHQPDLGVELDLQLYYQAKDGSLNDDPSKIGGFFTMLQYGVFFPLGGLGYLPNVQTSLPNIAGGWDLSAAQTVRWFVGVVY